MLRTTILARQKVKLATQLFSNTTSNAIRRCYSLGLELYNPTKTADFFQLVNDWFDVHNSTLATFKYPGKVNFLMLLLYEDLYLIAHKPLKNNIHV